MRISDNELCMLEQLCYLNVEVAKAAGIKDDFKDISKHEEETIGNILACFDDEAIKKLREAGDTEIEGACASGEEWANIIEYLKKDTGSENDLSDLVLSSTMSNNSKTTLALCFTEKNNPSEAIVAFKGTSGAEEWIDNVEGLIATDTKCQMDALDYIESLKYSSIIVTGHSKGGNKAMYVAITSDKVERCVAYDGQGFSREFIDKYGEQIQEKGDNISNYSLSTDYVHALMFPVPNSKQIYCKGYGVDNVKQHHSPNSFFKTDEVGNLVLDKAGNPVVVLEDESESIEMLHNFTTFIMNNGEQEDKEDIIEYVSKLLSMTFAGGKVSTEDIIDYALSDPDTMATIMAYLVKYMDEYDLDADDIDGLLDVIGLDELNSLITVEGLDIAKYHININVNLANIINIIKEQLNDGNDDWFIKNILLPILKRSLFDDVDLDISAFWEKINSKVKEIDATKGIEDYEPETVIPKQEQGHGGNGTEWYVHMGNLRTAASDLYFIEGKLQSLYNQLTAVKLPGSQYISIRSKLLEEQNALKTQIEAVKKMTEALNNIHSIYRRTEKEIVG